MYKVCYIQWNVNTCSVFKVYWYAEEFDADTFEYKTDSLEAGLMFCIEVQEESAVFGWSDCSGWNVILAFSSAAHISL